MQYQNPVLPGFHPDPSICRAGNDFYLVVSTFEYIPGVPVYHSRNLVQWELAGYCLSRKDQLDLTGCEPSKEIYAPTIRYRNGKFYMITTAVGNLGNLIVDAQRPEGPWSAPRKVDQGGIDPSLFWDDDGSCYYCSTGTVDGVRGIVGFKINPDTGAILSPKRILTTGGGLKCTEGPHLYKIKGKYYLMTAEGGTEYGHHENIFRSDHIWGPYEACPYNPILSHAGYSGPIQATGHADLIEDQNGNWWGVCLGIRNFGRCPLHNLGRETFLAPVAWTEDGWPVFGDHGRISLVMDGPLPAAPLKRKTSFTPDFHRPELDPSWQFVRTFQPELYRQGDGRLLLSGTDTALSEPNASPTMLCIRQSDFTVTAETVIDLERTSARRAGITAFYNHAYHYDAYILRENGSLFAGFSKQVHDTCQEVCRIPLVCEGQVVLKLETDRECYRFSYRMSQEREFRILGSGHNAGLSTETTMMKTFTGTMLGLFAEQGNACFTRFSCYASPLRIRPLVPSDFEAFRAACADEEVCRYMRFDRPESEEEDQKLFDSYLRESSFALIWEDVWAGVLAVKSTEDPKVWGLSIFLAKKFWNRGIATEALERMIPYAAETLGAQKLEAYVVSSNTASLRSLEHHGFVVDRELRFSDLEGSLLVLEKELD